MRWPRRRRPPGTRSPRCGSTSASCRRPRRWVRRRSASTSARTRSRSATATTCSSTASTASTCPTSSTSAATLEIPNDELVQGENTVQIVTGTIASDCGINHDDFILSNLSLELLGEVADGEENEYSYSMGDGSCGTNTALAEGGNADLLRPRRPGRHHRPDLPARHVRAHQRHAHPDRRHGVGRPGRAHGHRQQRTRRGAAPDAGRRHDRGR